ncbi:MAG: NifU family protein [Bacilli bacterium]|nr:NifU family protein [Bacilli bacterium]
MIEKKIEEILNKVRPYLNDHGGDVEFINYNDGTVYVSLTGMCANCMHANDTITSMIQSSLMFEMPEIKKVVNVDRSI